MDDYPSELAPELDEGGGVATPFETWWASVRYAFPHVPEVVARQWLHEHWGHSPFSWLRSADYRFRSISWRGVDLCSVRSGWCNFDPKGDECRQHGKHLLTGMPPTFKYDTAIYMAEHRDFPVPIVVLDNRDGHLRAGVPPTPSFCEIPIAYVLIEGHRRFNMALYLISTGKFVYEASVWLMERAETKGAQSGAWAGDGT